jgi:hypothetical protein
MTARMLARKPCPFTRHVATRIRAVHVRSAQVTITLFEYAIELVEFNGVEMG